MPSEKGRLRNTARLHRRIYNNSRTGQYHSYCLGCRDDGEKMEVVDVQLAKRVVPTSCKGLLENLAILLDDLREIR